MSNIPPPGEETSFPLLPRESGNGNSSNDDDDLLIVRHGSSLRLISQVCEFLANPIQDDTFNYIDPTVDHRKWSKRGMDLYYAAVIDTTTSSEEGEPASSAAGNNGSSRNDCRILCALRAATFGIMTEPHNNENENDPGDNTGESGSHQMTESSTTTSKKRKLAQKQQDNRKRFLIDYVYTAPESRGNGIAGLLVQRILELVGKENDPTTAAAATTTTTSRYVLSLEDSCVYWMEKHHFYLCQSPELNKLLNVFPDTHLLKQKCSSASSSTNNGANNVSDDANDDSDDDRDDEEDAKVLVERYSLTSIDDEDDSENGTDPDGENDEDKMQLFETHLMKLILLFDKDTIDENKDKLNICLNSLATMIQNAIVADKTEDRKKCQVRMNHPVVHERVFSQGGDVAMELLQSCGFQLEVNDDGDAILHFHSTGDGDHEDWLPLAISRLQHEAEEAITASN